MLQRLFQTENDYTFAWMRLILGVVFFAHGAQKALGWFDGPGFEGMMNSFEQMGIPPALAAIAIAAEFLGGLGLIVGFLARVAALGIVVNMLVAIAMVHAKVGFFMNWSGNLQGEGYEFHLLAIALGTAIVIKGAGAFSLDRLVALSLRHETPAAMESLRAAELRESSERAR